MMQGGGGRRSLQVPFLQAPGWLWRCGGYAYTYDSDRLIA